MIKLLATTAAVVGLALAFTGTQAVVHPAPALATLYVSQCTNTLLGGSESAWWDPDKDIEREWNRLEGKGWDIKAATLNSYSRLNSNTLFEWWQFLRANGTYAFSKFYCQIANGYYTDAWVSGP